jgi:hypothetical protein
VLKHLLFAALILATLAPVCAQQPVSVSLWPDKVLYTPGETAQFAVTVTNSGPGAVAGTLAARVLWEMDDAQKLPEQAVTVAPGETKKLTFTWKTRDVLGCEARAELVVDGRTVAAGAEYFNVCPQKEVLRVSLHGEYPDLFTYNTPEYLASLPAKVGSLRRAYCNVMEFFGWCPDNFANLAPAGDLWANSYYESKTALQAAVAEGHAQGVRSLHYAAGYTWSRPGYDLVREHPEFAVYDTLGRPQAGGTLNVESADFGAHPDVRAGYNATGACWQGAFFNFARRDTVDWGIQQLLASKRMFGWDGVRFDGHFVVPTAYMAGGRDLDGTPIPSGEEGEKITAANTLYTKQQVFKVFPDYLFMYNGATYDAVHNRPLPDGVSMASQGGLVTDESYRTYYEVVSAWNSWKAFAGRMVQEADRCRANGGFAGGYLPPPWCVNPAVDRLQYCLLFAAQNHPFFSFPAQDRPQDVGGTHFPIQKDIFRFATRFSAFLWGREQERVPDPDQVVSVSTAGKVWWRDYVYERRRPDGRRFLIVQLINEPPTEFIQAEKQQLPQPLADVTVKFTHPVKQAWVASAEPELNYQRVEAPGGAVRVPRLAVWTMVVAEMGGETR